MKKFSSICLLATIFLMFLVVAKCLRVTPSYRRFNAILLLLYKGDAKFQDATPDRELAGLFSCVRAMLPVQEAGAKIEEVEMYTTGSSLPDCSHACGPCSPCKRVMVSFKCSSIAESCPIVYRCMCNGKYYHVPSN